MTLRRQLIRYFKELDRGILGVELERKHFRTSRGGTFSPSTITRNARLLAEEGRLERTYDDKNLVYYKYKKSPEEEFHDKMLCQNT